MGSSPNASANLWKVLKGGGGATENASHYIPLQLQEELEAPALANHYKDSFRDGSIGVTTRIHSPTLSTSKLYKAFGVAAQFSRFAVRLRFEDVPGGCICEFF